MWGQKDTRQQYIIRDFSLVNRTVSRDSKFLETPRFCLTQNLQKCK